MDHNDPGRPAVLGKQSSFAIDFDGVDDNVEMPHFNRPVTMTVGAWVKLDAHVPEGMVVGWAGNLNNSAEFLTFNGVLAYCEWDNATFPCVLGTSLAIDTWHHVAVVRNGNSFNNVTLYVDGTPVHSGTVNHSINTNKLNIGAYTWATSTARLFDGQIDDVRIYKRALTATEIQLLANPIPGYTYFWDTFASDFFGQSDNVVLRFAAYAQAPTGTVTGTYQYPNNTPDPFQRPFASATTFPFRVRGTQVQVFTDTVTAGNELPGAIIYRLPKGQIGGAEPMADLAGRPFQTDLNGHLRGRGALGLGDQLVALYPVSSTTDYVIYHTSATPTATGLAMEPVVAPGVQTLAVSPSNTLVLFNLDVSLEWDASNDGLFLAELANNLRRTSEVLFDVSNGQIALGDVRIYQAKEEWLNADVQILASNGIRPVASIGGVVVTPTADIAPTGVINDAFRPGQIRMGPNWDPFGQLSGDLGQEWWRALAHEIGHYLLYLPDNYLGQVGGKLITTDCSGSFMTNSSNDAYSEFLTQAQWTGDCLQTVAQQTTGRTDWDTIIQYYPFFQAPTTLMTGPVSLPLALTQVELITSAVTTGRSTLSAHFFDLRNAQNNQLLVLPQAQGYLFKTQGTDSPADDRLIDLGTTSGQGDRIMVRGAEPGDRLCLFASGPPSWVGCETMTALDTTVLLDEATDWQPEITVTPVSSTTFNITVTQALSPGDKLYVQLLPAYQLTPTTRLSPFTITHDSGVKHSAVLTAEFPVFAGYIRTWISATLPVREAVIPYYLGEGWGARSASWAFARSGSWAFARSASWAFANTRSWGAPVAAGNGEVSVINTSDIFSDTGVAALQALSVLPNLDPWLTPVGQGYRVETVPGMSAPISRSIAFQYLQRLVPPGYENLITIYFSQDEGQTWRRLQTELDLGENLALATMPTPAEGIYVLVVSIPIQPSFGVGWNTFGYPVQETRLITDALASINGKYTAVASFDPTLPVTQPWRTYFVTVTAPFVSMVNTLTQTEYTRAYWLYATEAVTLFLAPENGLNQIQAPGRPLNVQPPPAVYYGWITATNSFTPVVGMAVTAWVNGTLCGQTTVQPWAGQLAYKIQVAAEGLTGSPNGCGDSGQQIRFEVGGQAMGALRSWDNSQAWLQSLSSSGFRVYLPMVVRPATQSTNTNGEPDQPGTRTVNSMTTSIILPVMAMLVVRGRRERR
jgi:hypothetical protein